MNDSPPDHTLAELWHRRLCPVNDWLFLSGDLHPFRPQAAMQIEQWRAARITGVIDAREEWTDEELVAELAPELRYWHLGTHDNGGRQDDSWFDDGLRAYREAIAEPAARLLVHCHMGINRGPSLGYRFLLEAGDDPIAALEAIRRARPIAGIGYAGDALDHYHRAIHVSAAARNRDRARLDAWMAGNGIDLRTLIRRIRENVV